MKNSKNNTCIKYIGKQTSESTMSFTNEYKVKLVEWRWPNDWLI